MCSPDTSHGVTPNYHNLLSRQADRMFLLLAAVMTAALVEEATAAARTLQQQAQQLTAAVAMFQVNADTSEPTTMASA